MRAAIILNGLCLTLFFIRLFITGSARYLFVPENMTLALLALTTGWLLAKYLSNHSWRTGPAILLTLLWLSFLPNTWYVMTDYIHIELTGEISQLFDVALITSLVACGFFAGFVSLALVHAQLLKRLHHYQATLIVTGIVLLASFAIYLGRDLRWNSWDILANPGGLLLNASDRIVDPFGHPRMLNVTGLFFLIIGGVYWAIWQLLRPKN